MRPENGLTAPFTVARRSVWPSPVNVTMPSTWICRPTPSARPAAETRQMRHDDP